MSYVVKCRKYINGNYAGIVNLRVPHITSALNIPENYTWYASDSPNISFNTILHYQKAGEYSVFGVHEWTQYLNEPIESVLSLPEFTNCLTYGENSQVVDYELIKSPDGSSRKIKITFSMLQNTTNKKVVQGLFELIRDGVTYCSGSLYPNPNREHKTISGLPGELSAYSGLPWITDDRNTVVQCSYAGQVSNTVSSTRPYSITSYYVKYDSTYTNNFKTWLGEYVPYEPDPDNPYDAGGISEEGGGGGNFSEDSDDVDLDSLPSYDAIDTGFSTIFTPSKTQLGSLANVMWSSNIFTALQSLVENISNLFVSLAVVPFTVTPGRTVEVTWFGLALTEIYLTLAAAQYYEFDMGSINMKTDARIFSSGSALDYSPYSKLGIFLPFIGYQDLDIDECRDAIIGLKYRIDILSGTCVALISINGNTVYQFTGNCLAQIPITNQNMQSLVTDAVNVGIAAAATHSAMGAASADMAAAEGSSKISDSARDAKIAHARAHVANSAGQLSSATANAAMGMKPTYGKAGAISATASLLAVKQPYLFLTTPRQSIPSHYQRYCGFPSNITGKLGSFSGFTVVEDIRLNGLVATSDEVSEIYELLKKGVII